MKYTTEMDVPGKNLSKQMFYQYDRLGYPIFRLGHTWIRWRSIFECGDEHRIVDASFTDLCVFGESFHYLRQKKRNETQKIKSRRILFVVVVVVVASVDIEIPTKRIKVCFGGHTKAGLA